MRLGILASHPIQYYSPWFRAMAKQIDLEVFFAHRPDPAQRGAGFGKSFDWDVDLLSGYKHRFLENISQRPGVDHFFGCDTPEIGEIISGKQPSEVVETALHGAGKAERRRQEHLTPALSPWRRGSGAGEGGKSAVSGHSSVVHQRFDAFIVMGWYLKSFWQAIRACRRAGVPVLIRGDSQLLTPRSPLKRMAKSLAYGLLLRQFDGFLVVGQRNREYLAHYGVPSDKMFFAPHFVDNEFFRQKAEKLKNQKAEIRKRWGIPEDAFCVLFCGKFISKKRPLDLVEAARILTAENAKNAKESSKRPVHLLFVGSGELGGQLRANCDVVLDAESSSPLRLDRGEGQGEVSNLTSAMPSSTLHPPSSTSARPSASLTGFLNQSELPAAYVAADVLVLPSESETWGLAVNEAMACGLPAIVSDVVGCAPDLIEEGRTGFTFALGDTAQLAQRLKKLHEMRQHGHDFAPALADKMKAYSIESAVAGTFNGLKSIQSQRKNL
jgi:glycosyltransferase involved in cell wall biosynthesis